MTNYEKYKTDIEKLILDGQIIAMFKDKIVPCSTLSCNACDFRPSCSLKRKEWLNAEYQEPEIDWTKVPTGTRVWVRDSEGKDWLPTLFLEVVNTNYRFKTTGQDAFNTNYRFKTTGQDAWVFKNRGSLDSSSWKYCKLDDSVDPTPYLKKVGE